MHIYAGISIQRTMLPLKLHSNELSLTSYETYSIMKIRHTLLLPLLYSFAGLTANAQAHLQDSPEYHKIASIVEEIKTKYAPDKRTALFELQLLDKSASSTHYEVTTTEPEALDALRQRLADHHQIGRAHV